MDQLGQAFRTFFAWASSPTVQKSFVELTNCGAYKNSCYHNGRHSVYELASLYIEMEENDAKAWIKIDTFVQHDTEIPINNQQ